MLFVKKKGDVMQATSTLHHAESSIGSAETDETDAEIPTASGEPAKPLCALKALDDSAEGLRAPPLDLHRTQEWKARAKKRVPVMSQTFSKAPMSFPEGSHPAFFREGHGCRVVDVDG